jgi:ribose transport system substrate-binding protein
MKQLKRSLFLFIVVSTFFITACDNPSSGGGAANSGKPRIAVIPKGTSHNFWLSIKAGADAAGKELGAEIIWKGPAQETDYTGQVNIVEDAISKRVDGILLAPSHGDSLVPVCKKAKEAGIPVVIMDSGISWEDVAYVSTDNRKGGEMAAERMASLLGGKGNVAIVGAKIGSVSTDEREAGFTALMEKKYPEIKLQPILYGDADRTKSANVAEDIITRTPGLNGIFGSCEPAAIGALTAINIKALQGKIKIVGFDSSPDLVANVRSGVIDSLVVQDPYKMGFEGVRSLLDKKANKPVERRQDTGVELVTRENMETPKIQKLIK